MPTTTTHYILASAGHVDHGKSALVKALTGADPDRLPEEKARGITIDLGFALLELDAPDASKRFRVGIVDVPGHEDFVKNMVAGVGSIDAAMLVVASDDGWMPQTEEHVQILGYLGVTRLVIALSKIDLAGGKEALLADGIRTKLKGTPFAAAQIVPVSVVTGQGVDDLKTATAQLLAQTPEPRDFGKPRLPVDRVFTLRGIGTVVTGTLTGGVLRRGQVVVVLPAGQPSRIRALQAYHQDVETCGPGMRTALNLADVEARPEGTAGGVGRGDVITLPELGSPSNTLDVVLERSERLADTKTAAARPLKDGAIVRIHHASANVPARLALLDRQELLPGQSCLAQARLDGSLFAFAGDRFVVRDAAEQVTLAGGRVLEPDASRRHWRAATQRLFLEQRAAVPLEATRFAASQLRRDGVVARAPLLVKSHFALEEIAAAARAGVQAGKAVDIGNLIADREWWQRLRQQAERAIDLFHEGHPERAGMGLNDLRSALKEWLRLPGVFEGLVQELCNAGFRQAGTAIMRASHRPALSPHLRQAGERLRNMLSAKPFDPPSRKELAPDSVGQQALRFLIETFEVVDVSPDLVMSREAYAAAVEKVQECLRRKGSATVSDLRQALGTSRRIMVPLVERLDREGVTRRQGDVRVLAQPGG